LFDHLCAYLGFQRQPRLLEDLGEEYLNVVRVNLELALPGYNGAEQFKGMFDGARPAFGVWNNKGTFDPLLLEDDMKPFTIIPSCGRWVNVPEAFLLPRGYGTRWDVDGNALTRVSYDRGP
jgi:hypothetical protein